MNRGFLVNDFLIKHYVIQLLQFIKTSYTKCLDLYFTDYNTFHSSDEELMWQFPHQGELWFQIPLQDSSETDVNYRERQACAPKRQTAEGMQVISKRNLCRDMTQRKRKTEGEKERMWVIPGQCFGVSSSLWESCMDPVVVSIMQTSTEPLQ